MCGWEGGEEKVRWKNVMWGNVMCGWKCEEEKIKKMWRKCYVKIGM